MTALVDYDIIFLGKSWCWLNDPELKALTMTPDFSQEDQAAYFKSLPTKKDYWIKGITENNLPIGAMGLKHINSQTAEYWGYIGEKEYWGKGIGSFMIYQAINKARELSLNQIYLMVGKQNNKAKELYLKKGFRLAEAGDTEKYFLQL